MKKINSEKFYYENPLYASVMIPLIERESGPEILFEVRSSKIASQPSDICFPGGKIEEDETAMEAVLRECCEELLIKKEQISIEASMDRLHNGRVIITPFIGKIADYQNTFSKDECEAIFTVPVEFFLKNSPENYLLSFSAEKSDSFPYDRINGGAEYKFRKDVRHELFYSYCGRTIWGLTANILHAYIESIK